MLVVLLCFVFVKIRNTGTRKYLVPFAKHQTKTKEAFTSSFSLTFEMMLYIKVLSSCFL